VSRGARTFRRGRVAPYSRTVSTTGPRRGIGAAMSRPVGVSLGVVIGCAAALAGVAAKGLLLRAGLDTFFLLLVLPVAAVAWRVGVVGGLTATVVAGLGDLWFFRPSPNVAPGLEDAIQLVAFLSVGVTISILAEIGQRTLDAARASQEEGARARLESEVALERLQGLERLLERLASTTTTEQVAGIMLRHAVPLVGAGSGAIVVLGDGRGRARLITAEAGSWQDVVHEGPALASVLDLGRSLWDPTSDLGLPPSLGAPDVLVPLQGRGPVIGALALRWPTPRPIGAPERGFIEAVATQCGQALERALLFDTERQHRRDAEASRREALRLGNELDAVLRSIGEPILVVGPDGGVTLMNRAAELLLGPVARLDDLAARLGLRFGAADLEPGRVHETRLAGTDRAVLVTVFGVQGRPSGARVVAVHDVTEIRRAEEIREVFIGMLSHELRTPVTTIVGGIDLLSRGVPEPERQALMDDVVAESERLRRLVDDVLVLSRFERRALRVEAEPILVHDTVAAVVSEESRRTHPPADIRIRVAPDLPPVRGDGAYVAQILRNLIGNAVKYGGPAGPVDVTATAHGDLVEVVVGDSGPGFPAADVDHLFDLSYRSTRTSMQSGAGIGLFVARQLARSMGGELSARGRSGRGAEFVLSLRAFRTPDEPAGRWRGRPDPAAVTAADPAA
jgi:K+-sensing histidine kinase KdpD